MGISYTDDGEPVALVHVEQDEQNAHSAAFAVAVAPARRGMGIGRRAFKANAARPELAAVTELVGEVEAGNVAAESASSALDSGVRDQQAIADSPDMCSGWTDLDASHLGPLRVLVLPEGAGRDAEDSRSEDEVVVALCLPVKAANKAGGVVGQRGRGLLGLVRDQRLARD